VAAVSTPYAGRFKDGFVSVNGLKLHYVDWGTAAKPTVLLVHGLNVQLHTWDPIADAMREHFHVVAVDLRGHGDSDWARDGYFTRNFVSDIRGLAERLDLSPFQYVGHSLGARIGIAYAGEYGDTLHGLVLSDTGPEIDREDALAVRARSASVADRKGFRDEKDALDFIRARDPDWEPIYHDLALQYQFRRNWAGKLVFKADPELFWINSSVSLSEVPHLWAMARSIPVPTLILRGRRSHVLSERIAAQMLETIPDARLVEFDTGHAIPRERPTDVIRELAAFLSANSP
jgi:pimeloyl-ACP methyl ester carboxylesterase